MQTDQQSDAQQFLPARGEAAGALFGAETVFVGEALAGGANGVAAELEVEPVNGGLQPGLFGEAGLGAEETALGGDVWGEIEEHHADFAEAEAGPVDAGEETLGFVLEIGGAAFRLGEFAADLRVVLRFAGAEGIGEEEDAECAAGETLAAEFFADAGHIRGERGLNVGQFGERLAEALGAADVLFRGRDFLKAEAAQPIQFPHDALADNAEVPANPDTIGGGELRAGGDAVGGEEGFVRRSDAPQVADGEGGEVGGVGYDMHASDRFLRELVAGFREHLRSPEADADGNAGPLADQGAQFASDTRRIGDAGEVAKGFVDAVNLHGGKLRGENGHDAGAHVAVERVVRAAHDDVVPAQLGADFELGIAHLDAEGLGFVAAGDHAAVVVAQDDDGASVQRGLKDALAGGVEIVAIHEAEEARHGSQRVNDIGDDAPHLERALLANEDVGKGAVFGDEPERVKTQAFDREPAIEDGEHDFAIRGFDAPIDNEQVTGMDAGAEHRVPLDPDKERRCGALDEECVEIELFVDPILGGRREAGGDPRFHAGQREDGEKVRRGIGMKRLECGCVHTHTTAAYRLGRQSRKLPKVRRREPLLVLILFNLTWRGGVAGRRDAKPNPEGGVDPPIVQPFGRHADHG